MDVAGVREYLVDFQKWDLPGLVERDIVLPDSKKVISVIGPRRAGKTFLLFQKMKQLLANGVEKKRILYLNLEDPRLIGVGFKDLREIIKLHWQVFPDSVKGEFFIFIDEPQNVENWEIAVRAFHDEGFKVFLTGSSSKLLSKEIATALRGRTLSFLLLPFSFKEFVKLKGFQPKTLELASKEKASLLALLNEYLGFGGFPEIALEASFENKKKIISEYFDLTVYRDVIERYNLRNTSVVKWVIKALMTSFSKEFSIHKLYLSLKAAGVKTSKNTLYSYLSILEDSFFVFFTSKFDYSIRKKELSISKAFLCDVGFSKLVETSADIGKKMENIVFLELERRKKALTEIFYWKNRQQEEVDFVVKNIKVERLIQVCKDITNLDVKKREIRALLKAGKELKCKNLLVVTEDFEASESTAGKRIIYTPLWKWLLKET